MTAASDSMLYQYPQSHAVRLLFLALLAVVFLSDPLCAAETASFQIRHIPLEEAKGLAQTQLSTEGRLSALPSRSLLIAVDKSKNIEKIRALLQQFDVPTSGLVLNVQILTVSTAQARLWAADGQQLSGGWKLIANPGSEKRQLMASKQTWLPSNGEARVETGGIRPVRAQIRKWLEQHGVADTPDLALHPIITGMACQISRQYDKQLRLMLKPWLRITKQAQVSASGNVEVLPDLGTTAATLKPPSTVAPIRLNIQPEYDGVSSHYIGINEANTEIDILIGKPVILLAHEKAAHALGDAILSKSVGSNGKFIALQLLLEK